MRHAERDPQLDPANLRLISHYWEQVRNYYAAFESDIRSGTSDVYVHGMPGGQYTNLREQARSLGPGAYRGHFLQEGHGNGAPEHRGDDLLVPRQGEGLAGARTALAGAQGLGEERVDRCLLALPRPQNRPSLFSDGARARRGAGPRRQVPAGR